MADLTENRILRATPHSSNYTVRLAWHDGAETVAKFKHLVGHGVFERLRDPAFFEQVSIEQDGRVLAWPDGIDFCADALWLAANPDDAPAEIAHFFPKTKKKHHQPAP